MSRRGYETREVPFGIFKKAPVTPMPSMKTSMREQIIQEREAVLATLRRVLDDVDEQLRTLNDRRAALWAKYDEIEKTYKTMLDKLEDV